MNPGICYVYEYDNNQRKRNAGFLKIVRHYQSCILQIHVRGLPLGNGTTLELCAFYLSGRNMVGATVASLTCFSRSISVRLPVSESHFPEHRPLSEIDGFLIRLPGSRDTVFWAASEKDLNMDPAHMILPGDQKAESPVQEVPPAAKSTKLQEDSPTSGTAFPPAGAPAPEASHFPENTPTEENHSSQEASLPQEENLPQENTLPREEDLPQENTLPREEDLLQENTLPHEEDLPQESALPHEEDLSPENSRSPEPAVPAEAPLPHETPDAPGPKADQTTGKPEESASPMQTAEQDSRIPEQNPHSPSARKIQRSDISKLPRRFWFLANNSFLLHGYHNYNHLLLVEEDGHVWLGVPGIYDVREARAADLFGFPQFTRSYAPILGLSEDERNDEADFGHWCRYLDSNGSSK